LARDRAADDPWWDTHFPPNGFNCRCYVQSLSQRDLARFGYQGSEEAAESPMVIVWVRGRPVETPRGIDLGFAWNVGTVRRYRPVFATGD
jgi:hypothetical protein